MPGRRLSRVPVALLAVGVLFVAPAAVGAQAGWPSAGHDLANTRNADSTIGVGGAAELALRWKVATAGDYSRATPAISGNTLVLGDQAGKVFSPDGWVFAVDKRDGSLLWKTTVEGGYPILTQSATIADDTVYIGAASNEEVLVRFGFPLTFRGPATTTRSPTR